jgi:AcrR family transcriptional regulator
MDAGIVERVRETVDGSARRRTGGRSARVKQAVLRATVEALMEVGLDGLNFSEIGRRAGVHATSVQRRWGTRENLLLEALVQYAYDAITIPDTGSLRGDLIAMAQSLSAYFATPIGTTVVQMLVNSANTDQAFLANRDEFVRIRFMAMGVMFRRARERGELRPDMDDDIALDLALGPLYVRTLITRKPINDDFIADYVDALLTGLARKA